MSNSDLSDYLADDFDPTAVTAPRLRSILVAHNVAYPSNAKKPALVHLFNQHVVPQRGKLLAERDHARRTSRGIVDAGPSRESSQNDSLGEDIPDILPRRVSTRSKSPIKSSRIKTEDSLPARVGSPTKRTTRSVSKQASLPPKHEVPPFEDGLRSIRKSRRRSPEIKQEELHDATLKKHPSETPFRRVSDNFSDDNPFQSGSSPAQMPKSARRKTADVDFARDKPSTARRRSNFPQIPSIERDDTPYDEPYREPITPVSDTDGLEPSEEFTPDAQLELEQEQAFKGGGTSVAKRLRPNQKQDSRLATPLWVFFTAILAALALWYRQEKIAVGYCGLGREATHILPTDISIPDWAVSMFEPQCEVCPPHAYCYEDFVAKCESDYVLNPHPLSLGGLLPLPPSCEPDGEKVRRVQAVADKAVEELRDRRAKFECGELVDGRGEQLDSPAMDEKDLKDAISKKRGKRMTNREFDELWEVAIGEITTREEVEVTVQTTGDTGTVSCRLSSTSLAGVPVLCALKRSFRLSVARYRFHIGSMMALVALVAYLWSRYRTSRAMSALARDLAQEVIELLEARKQRTEENPQVDGWLFLPNLRDDILRDIHSLAERERLWNKVKPLVEQNSNVRTGQREGKSGEVGRAWEWIGQGGTASDSHRRRSRLSGRGTSRFSAGAEIKTREEIEDTHSNNAKQEEKAKASRRWVS